MAVTSEHGRSSGPVWAGQRAAELAHADDAATQTSVLAGAAGLGTQQPQAVRTGNVAGLVRSRGYCGRRRRLRPWAFVLNFFGYMVGGLVLLRIWSRSGLYMIVLIWYVISIWYRSNS